MKINFQIELNEEDETTEIETLNGKRFLCIEISRPQWRLRKDYEVCDCKKEIYEPKAKNKK